MANTREWETSRIGKSWGTALNFQEGPMIWCAFKIVWFQCLKKGLLCAQGAKLLKNHVLTKYLEVSIQKLLVTRENWGLSSFYESKRETESPLSSFQRSFEWKDLQHFLFDLQHCQRSCAFEVSDVLLKANGVPRYIEKVFENGLLRGLWFFALRTNVNAVLFVAFIAIGIPDCQ